MGKQKQLKKARRFQRVLLAFLKEPEKSPQLLKMLEEVQDLQKMQAPAEKIQEASALFAKEFIERKLVR